MEDRCGLRIDEFNIYATGDDLFYELHASCS